MSTKHEKLAAFFAKKDKKIQKTGYMTVNQIAAQKLQKIQDAKNGTNKAVSTNVVEDQESEWKADEISRNVDEFEKLNDFLQKIEDVQQMHLKNDESEQKDGDELEKTKEEGETDSKEKSTSTPAPQSGAIIGSKIIVSSADPNGTAKKPSVYKPGNLSKKTTAKKGNVFSLNDQNFPDFRV